jgi:hypothetical protein
MRRSDPARLSLIFPSSLLSARRLFCGWVMPDLSSFHLDAGGLIASLFWGGIGLGFFVYGKKQRSAPPLFGGIALLGISYFLADSALWMSLAGAGILAGIYYWSRHED